MIRVLHVSDLHCNHPATQDEKLLASKALEDIRRMASDCPIDLVIFTGDLSMSGSTSEFEEARSVLLDPLINMLNLQEDRIILVPGNHDILRSEVSEFLEPGLLQTLTSTQDVDRLLASESDFRQATKRCDPWREFHTSFYGSSTLTIPNSLSVVHRLTINDVSIGIASLDSSWRATGQGDDVDKYHLLIGETQTREALDIIDECDLRLVAFHHPLEWLAQWNHPLIRDELERRGTIVFMGHEHLSDPILTHSTRGSAVYCKEGCLYQGRGYQNGYSVVDVDPRDHAVTIHLRGWHPSRQVFDADLNRAEKGLFETRLPQPSGRGSIAMPRYTVVTSTLATMAQSKSLFSSQLRSEEPASVDEVLVEPRLFPAPYNQIAAAVSIAKSRRRRIDGMKIVNPLLALDEKRVLVITGDPESGVTDGLYWLLSQQYASDGTRLPTYLTYEVRPGQKAIERQVRDASRGFGVAVAPGEPLPPLIVAIDDVHAKSAQGISRLADHIVGRQSDLYIIGCHTDSLHAIVEGFQNKGVDPAVAHLGPFGREQTLRLLELTGVDDLANTADRLLNTVFDENLPRSPFVLAALATVLASNPENQAPNVSTLLDSVIDFLLGKGNVSDTEAELDSRRREHLLETLSGHFTFTETWRMERAECEEFFDDYFKQRGIERSVSPGNVLNSILNRKILVEDRDGVGFRHGSLQHVFAAKYMLEDSDFADHIEADPKKYSEIIRHASALRRTDKALLQLVWFTTQSVIEASIAKFHSTFDLLQGDELAPLDDNELDKRIRDVRPKSPQEKSEELSKYYEDREISEITSPEWKLSTETAEALHDTLFLSYVLAGSELVDDVPLKTEVTKRAIMAWGALAEILGSKTEDWQGLKDFFEEAFPETSDARRDTMWELFVRIAAVISTAVAMINILGTSGLGAAIRNVADDEAIISSPSYSLFVTMLFSELNLGGYVKQLEKTYKRHRKHVVVSDVTRMMALARFISASTPDQEADDLLNFLADVMVSNSPNKDDVPNKSRRRSAFIQKLKTERARHRKDHVGFNLVEDILDMETRSDFAIGEGDT